MRKNESVKNLNGVEVHFRERDILDFSNSGGDWLRRERRDQHRRW